MIALPQYRNFAGALHVFENTPFAIVMALLITLGQPELNAGA